MSEFAHMAVGNGAWPIVIIDDFHPDTDSLERDASNISDFCARENDFYPGVKFALKSNDYADIFKQYIDQLTGVLGRVKCLAECTYAIANKRSADLLPIQCIPHYDTADVRQFALVHYLCKPDWGGTAFYRHRSTQIEGVDSDNQQSYLRALNREATTHGLPPAQYINASNALFEQIAAVQARFNRAIIYPASLLHSGNIPTHKIDVLKGSEQPQNLRLTITANLMVVLN